jgi:3-carboxy-cis,cis-muconate cycloisomerase
MGREEANDLVRSLSRRASDGRESLKEILLGDPTVSKHLSPDAIERAMDPASYLGSAGTFIDRTLALYQSGETA